MSHSMLKSQPDERSLKRLIRTIVNENFQKKCRSYALREQSKNTYTFCTMDMSMRNEWEERKPKKK